MKILIVTSEAADGYTLRSLIRSQCSLVQCVTSMQQAESLCRHICFDAVISVGAEWWNDTRSRASYLRGAGRDTHIVVLSSAHDEQAVMGALEEGVNQFLSLPIEPARLRRKLIRPRL